MIHYRKCPPPPVLVDHDCTLCGLHVIQDSPTITDVTDQITCEACLRQLSAAASTLAHIEYTGGRYIANFSDGTTELVPEGFRVNQCDGSGDIPAGIYRVLPIAGPGPGRAGLMVKPSVTKKEFRARMLHLERKNFPERFTDADKPVIVGPPPPA